jgi:peptidoglycan/xylan/chitin deacetylase (PgdA/CDA1 family)
MVRPPLYLRRLYPGVTWSYPCAEKVLYLTFDDGPIPEVTPQVLSLLKSYNAQATFFCIGENVEKHPDVYKQVQEAGHRIGNHTYHHYNSWKVRYRDFIKDVDKAQRFIQSDLFRPPYGKLTARTLYMLRKQYRIIMWDVISCDFDTKVSKEDVLQNVLTHAENGSIIVFHDSIKASKNMLYALPEVLKYFSEKGYVFRKID